MTPPYIALLLGLAVGLMAGYAAGVFAIAHLASPRARKHRARRRKDSSHETPAEYIRRNPALTKTINYLTHRLAGNNFDGYMCVTCGIHRRTVSEFHDACTCQEQQAK